jgi:hypothetical protein
MIDSLDRERLLKVVETNIDIYFDFFGNDSAIGNSPKSEFIEKLKKIENCSLKGICHPDKLATKLQEYDGFLICYNPLEDINSGSNRYNSMKNLDL